ncbi:ABC-type Fe3+-hydroxamate transport system, periplasmic component [Corynebacterium camporealensis]|uniref:ABC-type Fe3+-hydroxamate transport system, periplasmic component n=1 Tax=Corynebacterium camporealensis TaxID=161896 RepID=A0A0F6QX47_9CORY|nr:iron-siderophore ABC transporter substrate-binding protein [Corynebacterium camporealensis]AKE38448.1 ABC-type Fe3+-hydroxamate transport system, periplasmic component [Corynebacterium camporealensis]AVH87750.1 ABC-type Fe3+-hydroxamate transport system, periplasmic component [Corynebacterium camporealensis]MDY5840504.1 iron-siderophore ABC transporter substrate-binding protein [Corynebacterium camporealensis]
MRSRSILAVVAATSLAFGLAACSSDSASSDGAADNTVAADSAQFPVTVDHAFGSTTIEEAPARVATVGWGNHEVPLALGITPVGMSKATWGDDDDNGIMPWVEEKLDGDKPALFDETDGIPYEEIANTNPDVILAAYSGITQEDYDTLSKIAPVVAYPDIPWGTSLEDMTALNAKALGKEDEGQKLIDDLETQTSDALSENSELEGKKVLFTAFGGASDDSKIGFYTNDDPRMSFLTSHGMEAPEVVSDYTEKSDEFWVEVSTEEPELFDDVDLIIGYSTGNDADDKKMLEDMQSDPLLSKIPAVAEGNIVFLPNGPLGAAANPSPLSIPWGIDDYFAALADGLEN